MLPVLKDNIAKINRVYSLPGFRIGIPVGKFGLHDKNHFYCRIVPKYMVNEGTYSTAKSYKKISTEEQKQVSEVLGANSEGIYIEASKVFARLRGNIAKGYAVIETKNRLPKDINVIDLET